MITFQLFSPGDIPDDEAVKAFTALVGLSPIVNDIPQVKTVLADFLLDPSRYVIAWLGPMPVGIIEFEVHKRTVEAHIVAATGIKQTALEMLKAGVELAFNRYKRGKIVCKVPKAMSHLRLLLAHNGFSRFHQERDIIFYKMHFREYRSRLT